jgi:hypothetical protein
VKRQVTTKGSAPRGVIEDYTIAFLDGYLIVGKSELLSGRLCALQNRAGNIRADILSTMYFV